MLEFLTLKPAAFGLDISDLSLKIIKLKKKGRFLSLASFGETKVKPGIIEKGEIKDEKALAKIIKKAVAEVKGEKLKTKYVIASLPEEKAFLQVIQLPIMEKEEVKKAVYFEAENYIPLPIDKVYLDSQVVPQTTSSSGHLNVLIAAFPKEMIDPYVSSLKMAGLKPLALEIESQAVSRALIKKGISSEPLLLIDLGANRTSFIIFSGRSLRFTTTVSVSSQKFTETISKYLKVDFKKAETLKIQYGIQDDVTSSKVLEALADTLINLVKQIKKYLNYYQTHSIHEHLPPDSRKVAKILLCGGGVNLKGLADLLSLELRLPVELGNPWVNILPQSQKEVPALPHSESLRYTTALGLALRGIKT